MLISKLIFFTEHLSFHQQVGQDVNLCAKACNHGHRMIMIMTKKSQRES